MLSIQRIIRNTRWGSCAAALGAVTAPLSRTLSSAPPRPYASSRHSNPKRPGMRPDSNPSYQPLETTVFNENIELDPSALIRMRIEAKRSRLRPDLPPTTVKVLPTQRAVYETTAAAARAVHASRGYERTCTHITRITPRKPVIPLPPRVIDIARDPFTFCTAPGAAVLSVLQQGVRFESPSFSLILAAPRFRAERAFRHSLVRSAPDDAGFARPLLCPIRGPLGSETASYAFNPLAAAATALSDDAPASARALHRANYDIAGHFSNDSLSQAGAGAVSAAAMMSAQRGLQLNVRLGIKETRFSAARRMRFKARSMNALAYKSTGVNCMFAITPSKTLISRRAVDRNKVRRRLHGALLATLPQLLSPHVFCDLVLLAKPVALLQSPQGLCLELRTAMLALLSGGYPADAAASGDGAHGVVPGSAPASAANRPVVYAHPFWVSSEGSGPGTQSDLRFAAASPAMEALGLTAGDGGALAALRSRPFRHAGAVSIARSCPRDPARQIFSGLLGPLSYRRHLAAPLAQRLWCNMRRLERARVPWYREGVTFGVSAAALNGEKQPLKQHERTQAQAANASAMANAHRGRKKAARRPASSSRRLASASTTGSAPAPRESSPGASAQRAFATATGARSDPDEDGYDNECADNATVEDEATGTEDAAAAAAATTSVGQWPPYANVPAQYSPLWLLTTAQRNAAASAHLQPRRMFPLSEDLAAPAPDARYLLASELTRTGIADALVQLPPRQAFAELKRVENDARNWGVAAAVAAATQRLPQPPQPPPLQNSRLLSDIKSEPAEADALLRAATATPAVAGPVLASAVLGYPQASWLVLPSALTPSPRHAWAYPAVDVAFDAAHERPFRRIEAIEAAAASVDTKNADAGITPVIAAAVCPGSSLSWVTSQELPEANTSPLTCPETRRVLPSRLLMPAPNTNHLLSQLGLTPAAAAALPATAAPSVGSRVLSSTHAPVRAALGLRPAPTNGEYDGAVLPSRRRTGAALPPIRAPATSALVFDVRSQVTQPLLPVDALLRGARAMRPLSPLAPIAVQSQAGTSSLGHALIDAGLVDMPLVSAHSCTIADLLLEPFVGPAGGAHPLPTRAFTAAALREFTAATLLPAAGAAALDVAVAAVGARALRVSRVRPDWLIVGPSVVRDANRHAWTPPAATGAGTGNSNSSGALPIGYTSRPPPLWVRWQGAQPRSRVELQSRLTATTAKTAAVRVSALPIAVPPRATFPHTMLPLDRVSPALPALAGGAHTHAGLGTEAEDSYGAVAATTGSIALWSAAPSVNYPGITDAHNDSLLVPETTGAIALAPHFLAVRSTMSATADTINSDLGAAVYGASTKTLRFAPPAPIADAFTLMQPALAGFAPVATGASLSGTESDSGGFSSPAFGSNGGSGGGAQTRGGRTSISIPTLFVPLLASDQTGGLFNPRSLYYAQALFHRCLSRVDARARAQLLKRGHPESATPAADMALDAADWSPLLATLAQMEALYLAALTSPYLAGVLTTQTTLATSTAASAAGTGGSNAASVAHAQATGGPNPSGQGASSLVAGSAVSSATSKRLAYSLLLHTLGDTSARRRPGDLVFEDDTTSPLALRAVRARPRVLPRVAPAPKSGDGQSHGKRAPPGTVQPVRHAVRVLLRTLVESEDLSLLFEITPLFRRICLTAGITAGLV